MVKKRIKYLILASENEGEIYGAFFPCEKQNANQYLFKLIKKHNSVKLFEVVNLNKFILKIRRKK